MSSLENHHNLNPSTLAETKSNSIKSGVQSLEIGLSILDILIDNYQPMMLKDIAQVAQMHPAKAHRYLVSLIRKGYARQLDDGRYGVGSRLNSLSEISNLSGHAQLNQNNLLERLTLVANAIKERFHCGVQIAKWFSEGPIIIQSVEPDTPISIITRIGSRMPLTTSATGQLFASRQALDLIEPLVMAEWRNDSVLNQALNEAELAKRWQLYRQQLAEIRQQGYATVSGDMLMGINAISVPVVLPQFEQTGNQALPLEYALTVIGTSEQLPMAQQAQLVQDIDAICKHYQIA